MCICVFLSASLLNLQRRLIEEGDELSSQEHNHLFSQELYRDKKTVRLHRALVVESLPFSFMSCYLFCYLFF